MKTWVGLTDADSCPKEFIPWRKFLESQPVHDPAITVSPDDIALIAYTGGTTGTPKGVVHSQYNMAVNIFSHLIELGLQDDERLLLLTPLPHASGYILYAGLAKGATVFIERGFDPEKTLNMLVDERITLTFMVPTMIYRLLDHMGEEQFDFSHLRTLVYGAAPIAVSALQLGLKTFGPVFMQLYGQTEAPNVYYTVKARGSLDRAGSGTQVTQLWSGGVDDGGTDC